LLCRHLPRRPPGHKMRPVSRTLHIGVRDFALPVPRVGSIEAHSGYGALPQQGQELHAQLQATRAAAHPEYSREWPLSHTFAVAGLTVRVGGRADGFFAGRPPLIEEIKSAFDADLLVGKLRERPEHPYWLQLLTYGYIYFKAAGTVPDLRLV